MLGGTVKQTRWHLLGFCLMDNHVHLLVETPAANLGTGMQRAGLCERPEEWRWSSHAAALGSGWPAWVDASRHELA